MIEARTDEVLVGWRHAVALQDRVDKRQVRGEGDDGGVNDRVVSEIPAGAEPESLVIRRALSSPGAFADETDVEPVGVGEVRRNFAPLAGDLCHRDKVIGGRDLGDRVAVHEAFFVDMERAGERKDRLAVLDSRHRAGSERATVPDAVDHVKDRMVRISRTQEVGVEGVDSAALDRPPGGDESLRSDLTAEDPTPHLVEAHPAEDVHLDLLEIEQVDESRPVVAHRQKVHLSIMRKALRHPFASALEFRRSPHFGRFWRYSFVSVVSTVVSLGGLYLFFRVLHVGSAAVSNLIATSIASVPAYYLNRTWSWGKSGRSHLFREVVPFWAITAFGVIASTIVVHFAANFAYHLTHSHRGREVTIIVELANFSTYGVLWVGKFLVFNRFLFKTPEAALAATPVDDASMPQSIPVPRPEVMTVPEAPSPIALSSSEPLGESVSAAELS